MIHKGSQNFIIARKNNNNSQNIHNCEANVTMIYRFTAAKVGDTRTKNLRKFSSKFVRLCVGLMLL